LFRLLFDQEIGIESPGKQILRASDGRWLQENILSVDTNIYSEYVYDGETNIYYLPYVVDKTGIEVFINDVLYDEYELRLETRKIIFEDDVLSEGDTIRINYKNFNASVLTNTRILGSESGASAIIERASRSNTSGLNFYQLILDNRTILGTFVRNDVIAIDYNDGTNIIPVFFNPFSGVLRIDILDGGSSYNIGDPVIIRGPSDVDAIAFIDDVVSGTIDELTVINGGTGFKVGNQVVASGFSNVVFDAQVLTIDDSATNTANTISFNTDIISDYSNVVISSGDYGFPVSGTENVNSVISSVLSSNTITGLGPITSVNVLTSEISTTSDPILSAQSPLIVGSLRVGDLGCIGRISVIDGGEDYEVGDELIFTNTESFSGQGAQAEVLQVDANGSIISVTITNPGLGYQLNYFPTITVDSVSGSGANLAVTSVMGQGDLYQPVISEGVPGEIKSIKVLLQGSGYKILPGIDLTDSGSGTARASAVLTDTFTRLSGKWTTSDSIISDDQIRLQGKDYFIPYSYVISSKVEFNKYKTLLKNLLHPAGLINYSKYRIDTNLDVSLSVNVDSSLTRTVAGVVSISNNSNTVTGTNTSFTAIESLGILESNTIIVIDDQIRSVVSIVDGDTLTVNSNYTTTSTNNIVKILS
jgi:hypothetical protein